MPRTLGYHFVKSTYGQWLPGDERGHWSEAWDEQIGFIQPHQLNEGDPVRKRMAQERMKHDPVRLTEKMMTAALDAVASCIEKSEGGLSVSAAAIEPTHLHLLIPYSGRDIDITAKWLADQMTKRIHKTTDHKTPVWGKGSWCSFIFEPSHWDNAENYIERHNERQGKRQRPYDFVT